MTRAHPAFRDVRHDLAAPRRPQWEGLLQCGDVLYLPRGVWHAAQAVKGESVHVTVGVQNRTGADFIGWLADALLDEEIVRRDIPFRGSEEDLEQYVSTLGHLLATSASVSNLQRFGRYAAEQFSHRLSSSLPVSVEGRAELGPTDSVRWEVPLTCRPENHEEWFAISAFGRRVTLRRAALPVVDALIVGRELALGDLVAQVSLEEDETTALVADLLRLGLVSVRRAM